MIKESAGGGSKLLQWPLPEAKTTDQLGRPVAVIGAVTSSVPVPIVVPVQYTMTTDPEVNLTCGMAVARCDLHLQIRSASTEKALRLAVCVAQHLYFIGTGPVNIPLHIQIASYPRIFDQHSVRYQLAYQEQPWLLAWIKKRDKSSNLAKYSELRSKMLGDSHLHF